MGIIDFFSGPISGLVGAVGGIIDSLHVSDEEKAEARRKMQEIANLAQERLMGHVEAMSALQRDVIAAELQQDDAYTKRARPTLVYAGLGALGLNHILLPWIAHFTAASVPVIDLPAEFWWGWTGVVGAWAVGRSVEKKARIENETPPKLASMITGSGR